jgi:hypothetical protein
VVARLLVIFIIAVEEEKGFVVILANPSVNAADVITGNPRIIIDLGGLNPLNDQVVKLISGICTLINILGFCPFS